MSDEKEWTHATSTQGRKRDEAIARLTRERDEALLLARSISDGSDGAEWARQLAEVMRERDEARAALVELQASNAEYERGYDDGHSKGWDEALQSDQGEL